MTVDPVGPGDRPPRPSWRAAYDSLVGADALGPSDLERLAVAAHLVGRDEESATAWDRAHQAWLAAGDHDRAARCGFYLGFGLLLRGEMARAGGWLARAERLVAAGTPTCASRGLLLLPACIEAIERGDTTMAVRHVEEMLAIADQCRDPDLLAFAQLCRGQAALARGDVAAGVRSLDEVMVSVTTGEVSPITAGIVYCAVIEACVLTFDLRRAAEWTAALHAWCEAEPDLVPYRGQCLVHRSQVLQARGEWHEASVEADRASHHLRRHPALGTARYQQGELHRLRGDLREAAADYRDAAALGRDPVPGLALLRLAEGDLDGAVATIGPMLRAGRRDQRLRPSVLAAAVDVHVAAGDVTAARHAADELSECAAGNDAALLRAVADGATGSVLLAEGDVDGALVALRRACAGWSALGMPYDAARARVAIAHAFRALGDDEAAAGEEEAARVTFERLGALQDLAVLDRARATRRGGPASQLSERELEVVRQLAGGRTNREIAATLVISTHTVARHVQNIFAKLGVSSRAAATAYAYEHGLIEPSR